MNKQNGVVTWLFFVGISLITYFVLVFFSPQVINICVDKSCQQHQVWFWESQVSDADVINATISDDGLLRMSFRNHSYSFKCFDGTYPYFNATDGFAELCSMEVQYPEETFAWKLFGGIAQ